MVTQQESIPTCPLCGRTMAHNGKRKRSTHKPPTQAYKCGGCGFGGRPIMKEPNRER